MPPNAELGGHYEPPFLHPLTDEDLALLRRAVSAYRMSVVSVGKASIDVSEETRRIDRVVMILRQVTYQRDLAASPIGRSVAPEPCYYCPIPKDQEVGVTWTCPICGVEWMLQDKQ